MTLRKLPTFGLATLAAVSAGIGASAQEPPTEALSLRQTLDLAIEAYAEVRASRAELEAAEEEVGVAEAAYLPETDLYLQWNRATRNNVFGLVLPGGNLPGISGPALDETTSESTFGGIAGALFRWEAFDFGVRAANVRAAEAFRRRAGAELELTRIEVSLGAADAFLSLAGMESAVAAAEATVERMAVFERSLSALVANELRPGADLSLARAELARARTELIAAERSREEARIWTAEWIGRAGGRVTIDSGGLLEREREDAVESSTPEKTLHPRVEASAAALDEATARREAIAHEYRPKLDVLASFYARGTGARLDGTFEEGSAGLWPSTSNWALGLAVRFPILDFPEIGARTRAEEKRERAAEAQLAKARQHQLGEVDRARVGLDAALRIAENTPVELEAARALQRQAQARYDAGLADVLEVAEAERILRRAETDDALARLGVWRARLRLAAAEGDLSPVLDRLN